MDPIAIGIIQIVVALLAIIVMALIALWGFIYNRNRKLKGYYKIFWTSSRRLQPETVMELRGQPRYGFSDYYYPRDLDKRIREKLLSREDLLVVGRPLAGKTRAVYQALKNFPRALDVIMPRVGDVNPEDFRLPWRLTFWRPQVLILDDLDKFLAKRHISHLINAFLSKDTLIVATCRDGVVYQQVQQVMERELVLFPEPLAIGRISSNVAEDIAKAVKRPLPATFDGTVGSIFLDLKAMQIRFTEAALEEKAVLRSLKRLFCAGLYQGRDLFSQGQVQRVAQAREGLEKKPYEWTHLFQGLKDKNFLEILEQGLLAVEEVYLEEVVPDRFDPLDNLREMQNIFRDDPATLVELGKQAQKLGLVDIRKREFLHLALQAYHAALDFWNLADHPDQYAMTQNNLGNAYRTLGEVEDKGYNCRKAIQAFREALKVYTLKRSPLEYAGTQNNLGTAYGTLGEVEDKGENCRQAIGAFREALKVYTLERLPLQYAMAHNNLGNAYHILAEAEDQGENCRRAISAYGEALKVCTQELLPLQYALIQNNLGNAYRTLGEVEDQGKNCQQAIGAFEEALKVFTLERLPLQYAVTQNNLGTAYHTLAQVEDTGEKCRQAIAAFREALKVRTLERLPLDYAMTQNNLGNAYRTLGEVEDMGENCRQVIAAYGEALSVYTLERFPLDYAMTQNNLGIAYRIMGEVEDKGENCRNAMAAFREALQVLTEKNYPVPFRTVMGNLARALEFCQDELKDEDLAFLAGLRKINPPVTEK